MLKVCLDRFNPSVKEKVQVANRRLLRSMCTSMSKLENTSDSGSNLVTSDYPRLTTAAYQTCFLIRSLELHTTMSTLNTH